MDDVSEVFDFVTPVESIELPTFDLKNRWFLISGRRIGNPSLTVLDSSSKVQREQWLDG